MAVINPNINVCALCDYWSGNADVKTVNVKYVDYCPGVQGKCAKRGSSVSNGRCSDFYPSSFAIRLQRLHK